MPPEDDREFLHGHHLRALLGLHIHGVLDGVGGDDGGVVVGGVGGEAVGDDADGDAPLDEEVAAGIGGAAPDAGDADAGLAMPALEVEVPGHGWGSDLYYRGWMRMRMRLCEVGMDRSLAEVTRTGVLLLLL